MNGLSFPDNFMGIFGFKRVEGTMIIYMATCNKTCKSYIGVTTRPLSVRIRAHMRCVKDGMKTHFYNAIRKYGIDSFTWDVLDRVNPAQAFEREKYYIATFDTLRNGYNSTIGGEGDLEPTEATRLKRSISMKGKTSPMKGRTQSESARALIKKNNAKYWLGKHIPEETKEKVRAKNKLQDQSHHFASYELISPNKESVVFESVSSFLKEYGVSKTQFYKLVRGERKELNGWKLKRKL